MAMDAFSALPPLYSVKCVARILLPRAGRFSTRNTRSRTGMPTQRMFGAAGRCCAVMRVPPDQTRRAKGKLPEGAPGSLAGNRGGRSFRTGPFPKVCFLKCALSDPDSLAQRLCESCCFRGIVGCGRHQPPNRPWPCGVADAARDDVDMQLRHDIAECCEVQLVGHGDLLQ